MKSEKVKESEIKVGKESEKRNNEL